MKNYLEHKGFVGTVNFSNEDDVFYGKIEGVDDLITFEGESVAQLKASFQEMVEQHIQDCEKDGVPLEKSYKGSFNVRLTPELHKKAARKAMKSGLSLNQFIQKAIEKDLNTLE